MPHTSEGLNPCTFLGSHLRHTLFQPQGGPSFPAHSQQPLPTPSIFQGDNGVSSLLQKVSLRMMIDHDLHLNVPLSSNLTMISGASRREHNCCTSSRPPCRNSMHPSTLHPAVQDFRPARWVPAVPLRPHLDQGGLHTERLRGSGLFEELLGKPFHTGLRKIEFCDFPDFSIVVFMAKTTI
jgi:hypothetical protein